MGPGTGIRYSRFGIRGSGFARPETRDRRPEAETLSREIAAAAARTSDAKNEFVSALRRFVEGMSGTYGDEGPPIRKAAADMAAALQHWDAAIKGYRDVLHAASGRRGVPGAGNHLFRSRPGSRRGRPVPPGGRARPKLGRGVITISPRQRGCGKARRLRAGVGACGARGAQQSRDRVRASAARGRRRR